MSTPRIDVSIENKREEVDTQDDKGHPNTCPACGSHYRDDELERHLRVCPHCGHHFPVRALERIAQLAEREQELVRRLDGWTEEWMRLSEEA